MNPIYERTFFSFAAKPLWLYIYIYMCMNREIDERCPLHEEKEEITQSGNYR